MSWKLGLTLAIVAIIADTIYRARKSYAGKIRLTAAQRRTRRQLTKLGRAGYLAMHARPIPESQDQIDHLVVGPAGVFAIDSENWDKRLAVRTKSGKQLWHGPFSKKDRLQHAQWEAQRAAEQQLQQQHDREDRHHQRDEPVVDADHQHRQHDDDNKKDQSDAHLEYPLPRAAKGAWRASYRKRAAASPPNVIA